MLFKQRNQSIDRHADDFNTLATNSLKYLYTTGMFYYEVLLSSPQFHGHEALTYESADKLQRGVVVCVPMRQKRYLGIVMQSAKKPSYKTKPITTVLTTQPIPDQTLEALLWLHRFYPSPLGLIAQQALPSGLLLSKAPKTPTPVTPTDTAGATMPALSRQQQAAIDTIASSPKRSFLVHGDTGTGKTRLYMELAQQALKKQQSVLVITPEIGLTPQLVKGFQTYFAEEVILLHSQQTAAERRNQWLRILYANKPQIIIGPRSALFAPITQLGLIIVDEAHDQALKQDKAPRYHALRVAAKLSSLHKALFIAGSATPHVSEYWLAQQTGTPIIRIDELPIGRTIERTIQTVNLKEKDHFAKSKNLSNQLLEAIEQALQNKQQSLVFLNRRGTARLVHCQNCGWQALCPTCDLPMTYHGDAHEMRCHTCGYHAAPPSSCAECSSHDIVFRSIGTKSLVTELERLFPKARIKRYDTDNSKDERMEANFDAVVTGEVDIIVGTQMITKGLDLPHLSVVGIVLADTSLYLPDFSAEEQTYQILTQVIGRVGRGHNQGSVILQSYQPDSASIQAAVSGDWPAFYSDQIREREAFGFPPFYHFLKLVVNRTTSVSAQSAADQLANTIRQAGRRVEIVGPSPSFKEKFAGKYHWQLLVKAKDRQELVSICQELPNGWTADLDPLTLL